MIGVVLFITVIFGAYMMTTFEDRPYDLIRSTFMSIQIILCLATVLNPKRWIFRLLFVKYMFIAFWIVQIFDAFWIEYASRVLYERQIDTIDDLIGENYHLAGDEYVLNHLKINKMVRVYEFHLFLLPYFIFILQFSVDQMRSFEICEKINECLHRLEFDEKLAVASSRLHVKTIPFQQNIFCFSQLQNIQNNFISFMIRSDFPHRNQFDQIIKRIVASGLISKWKNDLEIYRELHISREVRTMNITDLQIMFEMFCIATVASFVIVLLEMFINYKVKSKNSMNFWKLLDKIICGKRCFLLLEPRINRDRIRC